MEHNIQSIEGIDQQFNNISGLVTFFGDKTSISTIANRLNKALYAIDRNHDTIYVDCHLPSRTMDDILYAHSIVNVKTFIFIDFHCCIGAKADSDLSVGNLSKWAQKHNKTIIIMQNKDVNSDLGRLCAKMNQELLHHSYYVFGLYDTGEFVKVSSWKSRDTVIKDFSVLKEQQND